MHQINPDKKIKVREEAMFKEAEAEGGVDTIIKLNVRFVKNLGTWQTNATSDIKKISM